jgi:regulator of sirC expression with transglutaminase-like and TPR domain
VNDRLERLDRLLAQPGHALDRVLAVVATLDPDGGPTEESVVAELDRLAEGIGDGPEAGDILTHLFGTTGFAANRADYYDPANSLIHRVLDRRRGIPLSLAAVAAEVARRRGVDLRPVGLPGHVLLGEGQEPTRWFDPFAAGASLDIDGCRRIFLDLHPEGTFHPAMLAPMPPVAVVVRTLNNLRVAYASRGQPSRMVPVLELRANLRTGTAADRLELARLLAGLGRIEQAAREFDRLAAMDRDQADAHRARSRALRARLN